MMTLLPGLERTDLVRVSLRRFTFSKDKECRAKPGLGHESVVVIVDNALAAVWGLEEDLEGSSCHEFEWVSDDDVRWPAECARCGEPFQLDDESQIMVARLYRTITGELRTKRELERGEA